MLCVAIQRLETVSMFRYKWIPDKKARAISSVPVSKKNFFLFGVIIQETSLRPMLIPWPKFLRNGSRFQVRSNDTTFLCRNYRSQDSE